MKKEISLKRRNYLYSKENIKKLRQFAQKRTKKLPNSTKRDSFELGYVLGVVHGDGNLKKYSIRLNCIDADFAEFFKRQLEKWSKMECKKYIKYSKNLKHKDQFCIELHSKEAVDFLKNFNISNLISSSEEMKIGFLRGFFDSEGNVQIGYYKHKNCFICIRTVEVYNTNLIYLHVCKILLEHLVIKTRNLRKGTKAHRLTLQNSLKNFEIFANKIGFSIKRKQQKLIQIINSYSKKQKEWSEEEISFIKQNYIHLRDKELSERLNRTKASIYMKRVRLNLMKRV